MGMHGARERDLIWAQFSCIALVLDSGAGYVCSYDRA